MVSRKTKQAGKLARKAGVAGSVKKKGDKRNSAGKKMSVIYRMSC